MLIIINKLLAISTIASLVVLLLGIMYLFFLGQGKKETSFLDKLVVKWGIPVTFFIALAGTVGSLYYSEIAKFPPCDLCWWQRVFMYPLVILLGLAWFKKDYKIIDYSLWLSALGIVVSVYQNYLYYTSRPSDVCTIFDVGTSCTQQNVVEFGFVTIPLMALTAFLLLFFILLVQKILMRKGE